MSVTDLWRARVEGKFGIKHYISAWIISARVFAVPWVFLYTLFGALLAGIKLWTAALGAAATASLVLLASHFINNFRDVERGVDRIVDDLREASKICSRLKPYTAAAWIVPLGITSIRFQKVSAFVLIALSALVFTLTVPVNFYTILFYLIGASIAITYTDFWKPARLGEVAAFLGHGFSTTTFGFLSQSCDVITAMISGVVPGLISGLAYSVDQYVDVKTDFVRRVRAVYEAWFNSKLPLGLYALVIIAFFYHVLTAWVVAGIYPRGVLVTYALIPLILITAPKLEYNRDRALAEMVVIVTFLLPGLMCMGVLL